jgi:hypothetical protein
MQRNKRELCGDYRFPYTLNDFETMVGRNVDESSTANLGRVRSAPMWIILLSKVLGTNVRRRHTQSQLGR